MSPGPWIKSEQASSATPGASSAPSAASRESGGGVADPSAEAVPGITIRWPFRLSLEAAAAIMAAISGDVLTTVLPPSYTPNHQDVVSHTRAHYRQ